MAETKYLNLGLYTNKSEGDEISDSTWNGVFIAIENAINSMYNNGTGSNSGGGDSHISFDSTGKHNLTIATTAADLYQKNGETKGGKINIEPISDLQIKSGDDIILYSHHRSDPTEVSLKITDGEDHPVKFLVNAADLVLTAKDKGLTKEKDASGNETNTSLYDDPEVLNITVNRAKNTRGYLKLRAQAIDLRSETHGGIALQPRGTDSQGHMNKIKFEHGGGDGLEFGTFNAEKTSLYTDEYRFKKSGVIKLATRTLLDNTPGEGGNDKYKNDNIDPTTHYSYQKNTDDDFYDNISNEDPTCTWEDVVTIISELKTMRTNNQGPWAQ